MASVDLPDLVILPPILMEFIQNIVTRHTKSDHWRQVLGTIYEEPEDIDLFVAGLAETPVG